MNLSAALAAGALVVIAETDDAKMPVPLKVDGDEVEGTGQIVYQFVLPAKRKLVAAEERLEPTTQDVEPTTQPARG